MNDLVSSDFLRVLQALKENIFRDLNVAKICRVMSITNTNYFCESIADGTVINAMTLRDIEPNVGDIVLVLFCDRDFRSNLKLVNYTTKLTKTSNNQMHSSAFGIIIGLV